MPKRADFTPFFFLYFSASVPNTQFLPTGTNESHGFYFRAFCHFINAY
ncbi:MAG: hypothetical protein ACLR56_02175 [Oscillospiraceae bacterium]